MAEEMGEKTEMPTARRLSESAERGQTGKSTDLSAAITLIGACLLIAWAARSIFQYGTDLVRSNLTPETLGGSLHVAEVQREITTSFAGAAWIALPIMGTMALLAYISQVWQVGFMISGKGIEPKIERLNFIGGFKKLLSLRSVVKTTIDFSKLIVIAAVAYLVVRSETDAIVSLAALPFTGGMLETARIAVKVAAWVLLVLLILGIIDRIYQRWQLKQDLKMTKQEVKDEMRSQEGDMEVKGRRLKFMRGLMMQRLQSDVPKADVIVTNPTHFSVALTYDSASMRAPKVVAKGADFVALKIRYLAAAHGIPIVERPPLARALYANVEVGQEVHQEHYEAIAEVLAYVYRLEGRAAG